MKDVKKKERWYEKPLIVARKNLSGQVHNFMKAQGVVEAIFHTKIAFSRFEKEAANVLCSLIFSHTISYFHKPWKKSAS